METEGKKEGYMYIYKKCPKINVPQNGGKLIKLPINSDLQHRTDSGHDQGAQNNATRHIHTRRSTSELRG
jgi:hypothetical protein